jgi:hypothetical protein
VKILATINVNGKQVTNEWELIENDWVSILVIARLKNDDIIGIWLDGDNVVDLKGNALAQRKHLGNLNITDAELNPSPD